LSISSSRHPPISLPQFVRPQGAPPFLSPPSCSAFQTALWFGFDHCRFIYGMVFELPGSGPFSAGPFSGQVFLRGICEWAGGMACGANTEGTEEGGTEVFEWGCIRALQTLQQRPRNEKGAAAGTKLPPGNLRVSFLRALRVCRRRLGRGTGRRLGAAWVGCCRGRAPFLGLFSDLNKHRETFGGAATPLSQEKVLVGGERFWGRGPSIEVKGGVWTGCPAADEKDETRYQRIRQTEAESGLRERG
jgi:hypothetical protein